MPKKQNRKALIILLMVIVFCGWWFKTAYYSRTIQFDLRREDVAKKFHASNAQWSDHTSRGLRLSCPELCYAVSRIDDIELEDFPYIKVRAVESHIPSGEMALFWRANGDLNDKRRIKLADSEGTYIVSAKSFHPWEGETPWRGIPINEIGVGLFSGSGAVTISEISLADSLTPWEWALFSASELRWVEPFLPYSINIFWGASIAGWSLTILAGCTAVLFLLLAIYRKGIRIGKEMLCLTFGLLLMVDAPFVASLIHSLKDASAQSAWKSGKEEEERSRFGPEYADLASALRRAAPDGSSIYIPPRKPDRILGESEWISFQLWPQYRTVAQIEDADHILLLHPREARFDPASGALILPNHNPVKVSPLAIIHADVMLLKRSRDQ
jgi:hypothetical protein